tara:strand:+ start:61 stop:186 length:126 start_codon:yes stop_codon:yes gene_type:complete
MKTFFLLDIFVTWFRILLKQQVSVIKPFFDKREEFWGEYED